MGIVKRKHQFYETSECHMRFRLCYIPKSYQVSRTSYFRAICFRTFNFRAVKKLIYSRTNNFRAPTKFIFLRRSKLWLKMLSKTLGEICRSTGFLSSVFYHIWTEWYLYFSLFRQNQRHGKIRIRLCQHTGKYGSEKAGISTNQVSFNTKSKDQKTINSKPWNKFL